MASTSGPASGRRTGGRRSSDLSGGPAPDRRTRLLTLAVAASVAVAFADSSVVVLALPDLYSAFRTSIVGVSWVITAYNLVVCAVAFSLAPLARKLHARALAGAGLVLFVAGSVGCASSWSLVALVAFRCLQGLGGALLLAAALPILAGLAGDAARGTRAWILAGTLGAAVGPALGGVLTQLADWRAIFAFQAPVAASALVATFDHRVRALQRGGTPGSGAARGSAAAGIALALIFAALVGALFLAVLLVITVWKRQPVAGALIVSVLPLAAVCARRLAAGLDGRAEIAGGTLLLAAGLASLALLPAVSDALVAVSLAFCGLGLGLSVPPLTRAAMGAAAAPLRSGAVSVGARHLGLVVSLALIAPLLSAALDRAGERALLAGTRVIMDGNVDLVNKVPIALQLRDEFLDTPTGEVPDLAKPFDERGARTDARLRALRDRLLGTLRGSITRGFRSSFALSALFALATVLPAATLRRGEGA